MDNVSEWFTLIFVAYRPGMARASSGFFSGHGKMSRDTEFVISGKILKRFCKLNLAYPCLSLGLGADQLKRGAKVMLGLLDCPETSTDVSMG